MCNFALKTFMKKLFRHITFFSILLLFLVSFTGLSIKKHYCSSCSIVVHYIFVHPDCCSEHAATHAAENFSCCPESKTCSAEKHPKSCAENDCCEDTSLFVKLDVDFVPSEMPRIDENKEVKAPLLYYTYCFLATLKEEFSALVYVPPPLPFAQKSFIVFSSKFIFYEIFKI